MIRWLVNHKLATGLIILNILDVVLTFTIGTGFGSHKVYEGNPLGLPTIIILKTIFVPLVIYLCVKYHKKLALIITNTIYSGVITMWLIMWVIIQ
jgi:hypothetical protein